MEFWTSKVLAEDFHHYVGRRLGLRNNEIKNSLGAMVGKRTDFVSHYFVLKNLAECKLQRIVALEILVLYIMDFMGTEWCYNYENYIKCNSKHIKLERIEQYLRNVSLPDGSYGLWIKMLDDFHIDPPSSNINLDGEFRRLGIPEKYATYINQKAYLLYYKDRRFSNLASCVLETAESHEEFYTAEKIQKYFLSFYYRQMGMNNDIKSYRKHLFHCKGVGSSGGLVIPFLPKLCKMKYSFDFYSYVNNMVRGEHNLFKLEWNMAKCIRFSHHTVVVNSLDKTSNDFLDHVANVKDLFSLTFQNDKIQNDAVRLLTGDYGSCIVSRTMNSFTIQNDEIRKFMQNWYDHCPIYVIKSIEKSTNNGKIDAHKFVRYMRRNLKHCPRLCEHLSQSKPFGCH